MIALMFLFRTKKKLVLSLLMFCISGIAALIILVNWLPSMFELVVSRFADNSFGSDVRTVIWDKTLTIIIGNER